MIYRGQAQIVANEIIQLFESGNLPRPLAQVYLDFNGARHASNWSYLNQILVALRGYRDARTFKQWKSVNRSVRKGQKCFHILAPITIKRNPQDGKTAATWEEEEESRYRLVGVKTVPVFGYEQTDGEPIPDLDAEEHFIAAAGQQEQQKGVDRHLRNPRVGPCPGEGVRQAGNLFIAQVPLAPPELEGGNGAAGIRAHREQAGFLGKPVHPIQQSYRQIRGRRGRGIPGFEDVLSVHRGGPESAQLPIDVLPDHGSVQFPGRGLDIPASFLQKSRRKLLDRHMVHRSIRFRADPSTTPLDQATQSLNRDIP